MENPNRVDTSKLRKEIRLALWAAEYCYEKAGEVIVLFHTYDGKHMAGSLHFKHRAVDVSKPKEFPDEIVSDLRLFLGPEYDVLAYPDHLHIEWDPK